MKTPAPGGQAMSFDNISLPSAPAYGSRMEPLCCCKRMLASMTPLERRVRDAVIVRDHGICWICGHGGARQKDEIIPRAEGGDPLDMGNCRAAHGANRPRKGSIVRGSPCPVCSPAAGRDVFCNQIKNAYSMARCRKIIREWTGGKVDLPDDTPDADSPPPPGVVSVGRVW